MLVAAVVFDDDKVWWRAGATRRVGAISGSGGLVMLGGSNRAQAEKVTAVSRTTRPTTQIDINLFTLPSLGDSCLVCATIHPS